MQRVLASQRRIDQAGVVASCMCGLHCAAGAAGAVMIGSSGLLGAFLHSERLELGFLACTVGLAVTSVALSYRRHHDRVVLLLAASGLVLLATGRALQPVHLVEVAVSVLGTVFLAAGHLRTAWRLQPQLAGESTARRPRV